MKQKRKMNRTGWGLCLVLLLFAGVIVANGQHPQIGQKLLRGDSCQVWVPCEKNDVIQNPAWFPKTVHDRKTVTRETQPGAVIKIYNTNNGGCTCCQKLCDPYQFERPYSPYGLPVQNDDWLKWLLFGLILGIILGYLLRGHNTPPSGGSGSSNAPNPPIPPITNSFSPVNAVHHHYHGSEEGKAKKVSATGKTSTTESVKDKKDKEAKQ